MKDSIKDIELVERFKKGDEKAFNELVNLYKEKIYYIIFRMVRNHEDSADLSLETFAKAYFSLKDFKGESSVYTYLCRIAINLSINFCSRDKHHKNVSIDKFNPDSFGHTSTPLKIYEQNELQNAIDNAIKKLPEKQRAIFVLRHYENLQFNEISSIMKKAEGTIKSTYFTAVKKLQKELRNLYDLQKG